MMYHNVLHVFHDVLLCLTMFYDVLRVAQRSATADRLRDHDNTAGIRRWCRRDRRYRRARDPMLNSILNGGWSNSVPGRQIPEGPEQRPQWRL